MNGAVSSASSDRAGGASEPDPNEDHYFICRSGGELLCCDTCERAFHVTCCGLADVPEGAWSCYVCETPEGARPRKPHARLDL